MNKKFLYLVLFFASMPCLAEGGFSLGLSGGSLKYDDGNGSMKGISAAYAINKNVYFELSHLRGDLDSCSFWYCEDYDYTNTSLYTVLRSSGRVYVLGKAGVFSTTADDDRVNKTSVGIGAGFEATENIHLELEYLKKEISVRYTGLTLRYWF